MAGIFVCVLTIQRFQKAKPTQETCGVLVESVARELRWLVTDLKPLDSDANSEEDTDGEADVAAALSNRVDEVEDVVVLAKCYGDNHEVAQQENKIPKA